MLLQQPSQRGGWEECSLLVACEEELVCQLHDINGGQVKDYLKQQYNALYRFLPVAL